MAQNNFYANSPLNKDGLSDLTKKLEQIKEQKEKINQKMDLLHQKIVNLSSRLSMLYPK